MAGCGFTFLSRSLINVLMMFETMIVHIKAFNLHQIFMYVFTTVNKSTKKQSMIEPPVIRPRCPVRTSHKAAPSPPPICLTKYSLSAFLYCPAFFDNTLVLHKARKCRISCQIYKLTREVNPSNSPAILIVTHNSFPAYITKPECKCRRESTRILHVYTIYFVVSIQLPYSLKQ